MKRPWPLLVIRALWTLYPPSLRREYGARMEDLLLNMWREHRAQGRWIAIGFWLRAVADVGTNGLMAHLSRRRSSRESGSTARVSGGTVLGGVLLDVRFGVRSLRRRPGFSAVVVLTLAVGIGASAAIFSIVNAVVLAPLPYPEPERLVGVWHVATKQGTDEFWHAQITYDFYKSENGVFDELGAYWTRNVNVAGGSGGPEWSAGAVVSASLLRALGVPAELGRTFSDSEELPGSERVVVLSHGAWTRRFGAEPSILGRSLRVDGVPHTVIGVMPSGFSFPRADTELWLPMELDPTQPDRSYWNWRAVGRLGPGVTLARAEAEMNHLVERLPGAYPDPERAEAVFTSMGLAARIHPLKNDVVGAASETLILLLGCVGLILIISCANATNLLLVRAEGRSREMALRTAMGAGRATVARAHLAESTVLALIGGAVGVLVAQLASPTILALSPQRIPRTENVRVDLWVVGFTLAVSLICGFLCGLAPSVRQVAEPAQTLREGGGRASGNRTQRRLRSALVLAQLTLAFVLMAGSGLLVRSYLRLGRVDPGFDPSGVLTVQTPLPAAQYSDASEVVAFLEDVLRRVEAMPGVTAAGALSGLPYSQGWETLGHSFEGNPISEGEHVPNYVTQHLVPGTLQSLGIPLVAGRHLDWRDVHDQTGAVVISESLAARQWPGEDPIGRRLIPGRPGEGGEWKTVVGVVGAARMESPRSPPSDVIYYPLAALRFANDAEPILPTALTIVARTEMPPTSLARAVGEAVSAVDPEVPVANVRTLEDVVAGANAGMAFTTLLVLIAAAIALLLGVVGLYGMIAYVVRQRTREIGIRLALGASRTEVIGKVLAGGLAVVVPGTFLGLAGVLALSRFLRSLLFEVSPVDLPSLVGVAALILATSAIATLVPARRAARVDPVVALRSE